MDFETFPDGREEWLDLEGVKSTCNATLENSISSDGTVEIGKVYHLPARQGVALRVTRGQSLKVINTHGTQVVDFWGFKASNLREFMSMEHLRTSLGGIFPKVDASLVSNRRQPLMTLVEDTSPGVHDTFIAACDIYRYRELGVDDYHDNCTDNLRMALLAIGLRAPEVPAPLNLWMNIPVHDDGHIDFLPTVSKPGDYVVFKALEDLVFVMSACPQDMVPINGDAGHPVGVDYQVLADQA